MGSRIHRAETVAEHMLAGPDGDHAHGHQRGHETEHDADHEHEDDTKGMGSFIIASCTSRAGMAGYDPDVFCWQCVQARAAITASVNTSIQLLTPS